MSTFNNFTSPFDLNAYAKEHHQAMKAKGFWDGEFDIYEKSNLIISEIGELIDAHRLNKRVSEISMDQTVLAMKGMPENLSHFEWCYKNAIKGTIEEELADIVLRVLDLAGYFEAKISLDGQSVSFYPAYQELVWAVSRATSCLPNTPQIGTVLSDIISGCELISESLKIDLWTHVQLKSEYNKSRPHKHGKNY